MKLFKQELAPSVKEALASAQIDVKDFYIGLRREHFVLVEDKIDAMEKYLNVIGLDPDEDLYPIKFYDNEDLFNETVKAERLSVEERCLAYELRCEQ